MSTYIDYLNMKLERVWSEHSVLDRDIKYGKNYLSPENIKIKRKNRAKLRKEINELKIKIQLLE